MIYNKLVRDMIPEVIKNNGQQPVIRILEEDEYIACLEAKLDEEVREFHEDKNLEELADILEVVYALTEATGHSRQDLLDACDRKRQARGGFRNKVFLISNEG